MAGIAPTIFGTGEQSRDFTFVANAVNANLLAATAPAASVAGNVYNIGTGRSQNLNQVYAAIAQQLGFTGSPVYGPPREGDIAHSLASIERAQKDLGYSPMADFAEGLRKTVNWYLESKSEAVPDTLQSS